jgi:hypothetical protein
MDAAARVASLCGADECVRPYTRIAGFKKDSRAVA